MRLSAVEQEVAKPQPAIETPIKPEIAPESTRRTIMGQRKWGVWLKQSRNCSNNLETAKKTIDFA